MPAMPPIITGLAIPIFMLMFIPIRAWFTGTAPCKPVAIEVGIPAGREAGMPVAIDAGIPIVMELPANMELDGLMGVTLGEGLRFSPPKFWANKLIGGTPGKKQKSISDSTFCRILLINSMLVMWCLKLTPTLVYRTIKKRTIKNYKKNVTNSNRLFSMLLRQIYTDIK